jgi:hypothetical protein
VDALTVTASLNDSALEVGCTFDFKGGHPIGAVSLDETDQVWPPASDPNGAGGLELTQVAGLEVGGILIDQDLTDSPALELARRQPALEPVDHLSLRRPASTTARSPGSRHGIVLFQHSACLPSLPGAGRVSVWMHTLLELPHLMHEVRDLVHQRRLIESSNREHHG